MNLILQADRSVLLFLNGWTGHSNLLDLFFKTVGEYIIYLVPFLLLGVWIWFAYGKGMKDRVARKLVVLQAVIAGLFGWFVINPLVARVWSRPRPFEGLGGVREVLLHRPDKSFPSDHATFLFSIGFYFLYAGWKKTGWTVIITGIFVSIARVILGVHYPLDILGGLVIGAVGAWLIFALKPWVESYLAKPIIKLAGWLKL